jgi:sucrose phosphorylase
MNQVEGKILEHLAFLYSAHDAPALTQRIINILARFKAKHPALVKPSARGMVSERDAILITYGDMVQERGQAHLQTLFVFLQRYLPEVISSVHILPFYPYSSDDGFSVINYRQVNPALGNWADVTRIGKHYRLMFDAVVNHISSESDWFQAYLRGEDPYNGYFITLTPETDLSEVRRPRATPLLTPFDTVHGTRHVWTTFSADQVDLNFSNPEILLEIITLLLFYVAHGAEFIRLDAIAYLWKELGTSCIHLPQTHSVIKLFRTVLDAVAPGTILITETNVPHRENISYFGDGSDEAQMVYNFTLPPLTLHTFHSGNTDLLTQWASTLTLPSKETTFFNFLASHDGIGVTPLRGWLNETELGNLLERVQALGGYVSYKNNPDGSQSPYEMNINYLDALDDPENPETDPTLIARRFLAAQAIMLSLRGVPGIYFHSIVGSRNWKEGAEKTGRFRTINREKLQFDKLEAEFANPRSLRSHIYVRFCKFLEARKSNAAFHPFGGQEVLSLHSAIFSLLRISPDGLEQVLCLHNISPESIETDLDLSLLPLPQQGLLLDIISKNHFPIHAKKLHLRLGPYEVLWLGTSPD